MPIKNLTPTQLNKVRACLHLSTKNTPDLAARMLLNLKKVAQDQLCLNFYQDEQQVTEVYVESKAQTEPTDWLLHLGRVTADAFDCELAVMWGESGQRFFITGKSKMPKSAVFALVTLKRLLFNARRKCLNQFTRASNSKKRQLGDVFAALWLKEVARKIKLLNNPEASFFQKTQSHSSNNFNQLEQYRTVGA